MKKRLFMYFLIFMFIFIMGLYIYTAIENFVINKVDVIKEDLNDKAIIFYEETIEDNISFGKYLQNNGVIYLYSYQYSDKDSLEDKISKMKDHTESKLGNLKKIDKGYLNKSVDNLKNKYFHSKLSTDKLTKYIYYIDYKKNRKLIVISSGADVYKNKSISSSRIISILKKYSIRVD